MTDESNTARTRTEWPSNIEARIEDAIAQSGLPITFVSPPQCSNVVCEIEITGTDLNPSNTDWMDQLMNKLPVEEWGAKQVSFMTREKYPGVKVNVLHISNVPPHPQ